MSHSAINQTSLSSCPVKLTFFLVLNLMCFSCSVQPALASFPSAKTLEEHCSLLRLNLICSFVCSVLISKGTTPTDISGTEEVSTANESDDREKLSVEEVSSPSALHSPGPDFNLDFVKYTCNTRKTAMKEGDVVTISSVTQSRVQIEGFTSGRNMLGEAKIEKKDIQFLFMLYTALSLPAVTR